MMENCRYKETKRDLETKKRLISRANRISGQLTGIAKMLEEDRYCVDILTQLSGASAALKSLATEIFKEHLSTCAKEKLSRGDEDTIDEIAGIFKKF